jgi:hypothetical protein
VTAFEAEVLDIGLTRLTDPQTLQAEQDGEGCVVAVETLGGEQEHPELGVIRTTRFGRMHLRATDVLGRIGCDDSVDVGELVEPLHRGQATVDRGRGEPALFHPDPEQFDVRACRFHDLDTVMVGPVGRIRVDRRGRRRAFGRCSGRETMPPRFALRRSSGRVVAAQ